MMIPAQPGWYRVTYFERVLHKEPIIAWHIDEDKISGIAFPICLETHLYSDYAVETPDLNFIIPEDREFDSEIELIKYFSRGMVPK